MESLKKFWHWADNEKPTDNVFDVKSTNGGPLSEEAQEALHEAVEVVNRRAPDGLWLSDLTLRPAIKLLSFAILEAWKLVDAIPRTKFDVVAAEQAFSEEKRIVKGDRGAYEFKKYTGKVIDLIIAHDDFARRMKRAIRQSSLTIDFLEHVSLRVDSRGIYFQSLDFSDINDLMQPCEFETSAGNGSIDEHKLYLVVNTFRLRVIARKKKVLEHL